MKSNLSWGEPFFSEKQIKKMRKTNYVIFGICASLLLSFAAGIWAYRCQHSFSSEKWMREPKNRWKMADDLVTEYELVGMTEFEIRSLLGDPSNDSDRFSEDHRFVYNLGEAYFNIDSDWLLIDFSEGIVDEYCFTSD